MDRVMSDQPPEQPEQEGISVKAFFEAIPPGKSELIRGMGAKSRNPGSISYVLRAPAIQLYCDNDACQGIRYFEPSDTEYLRPKERKEHFLTFECRNCKRSRKTYAFWSRLSEDETNGELMKFGEYPPFGPPTPARVITMIGGEREYYLKGRRAENQGLGIAAFAYYRRVVENQKVRIIDEILRVAQKVGAAKEVIEDLTAARSETQFSRAVEAIKHGVPQSLLIDGHNPLTLLHSALSEGLHAQTDEQCLELATSIRIVLTELVERIGIALKEEVELTTAVSRLLQASAQKAERSGNEG
jgi:hypothetical protein